MKNLLNIRIPSIIGILLLLVGVGVTAYMVDQGIILEGRAAPEEEPSNIAITNVSSTGFTLMYTTDEAVPGTLTYGTSADETIIALDDRDKQNGSPSPSYVHHISVNDLKPDTTYYFSILSGDTLYTNDGEPYEITTAPDLTEQIPEQTPITGKITIPETVTDKQLLILITSDDTQEISAVVSADGSYTFPTSGIRNKDLSSYAVVQDDLVWTMSVLNHDRKSEVTILAENANPVPLVMFGQTYDFTITTAVASTESASESASTSYPDSEAPTGSTKVAILSPEDKESFSDEQPLFQGTGVPGEEITIVIQSDPINATVEVDPDGSWEFRPQTPLPPGNHTLTITTKDISGTVQTLTRSFTVFAQGSQFIEPSVSPTRTPTPTIVLSIESPTPTQTASPSATPTVMAPTVTPTLTPTSIVTQPTAEPSHGALKPTGPEDTMLMIMVGITAVVAGGILFFLTKGSLL